MTPSQLARVRILRPSAQLFIQSRTVAAASALPVFAAMLWFAIPRGTWPRVLVAIVVVAAAYLVAIYLLSSVRIVLDRDGITENGFFVHQRRISAKRIANVVIVQVYRGQSLDTAQQLFVLDATGELLLRMRGQYWSDENLGAVASAYGVPVRRASEPISRAELRENYADVIFWFEKWPWLKALCLVGAIAALSLVLIALMSVDGLVAVAG
ncbi:hypothetical protein KPL76_05615 [Subtercola sp. PAMC28395]|uniref:hypothetical protein n=1 Tax=Subtercola sp. PAMC28395 TaxID=2846775 RepID=UPI001C0B0854|nr:hypothetical protein [Subtercola sp. PAMC28395]QWT24838.1 hypothetical protein KPL76_05615 [Subtercola sp. PAMC28395]